MQAHIDSGFIEKFNKPRLTVLEADYIALAERLNRYGIDIENILQRASEFSVAIPSWGVSTGGTRFARFPGPGEPRHVFDKLDDCGVVQKLTRVTPTVSLHIPWDNEDPAELREKVQSGGAIDPVAAYRASGYRETVSRVRPAVSGAGGGIA